MGQQECLVSQALLLPAVYYFARLALFLMVTTNREPATGHKEW